MKQIASAYTYNKTSGVISLTGVNIDRDQLLLIVNTTRNVTYYNFADSTTTLQAFTQGANTSVTLASSVISASSAHNNADALTIYYDDQVSSGVVNGTVTANTGLTQPLTDTQLRATSVPVSLASLPSLTAGSAQIGSVSIALSTAGVVTTFTSITSATLIASNSSRKMLTIQNTGAGILYVLFGSGTASSTNFSVQMNSGDFYENNYYNGQMNAIFATAGTAYVTSLT